MIILLTSLLWLQVMASSGSNENSYYEPGIGTLIYFNA